MGTFAPAGTWDKGQQWLAQATRPHGRAYDDAEDHMEHILVGIDGTDAGDAALRWALSAAAAQPFDVMALHAWQAPYSGGYGWTYPSLALDPDMERHASLVLDNAVARATARSLVGAGGPPAPHITPVVMPGPAAQVLEEQARSAALLVLGRHHETLVSRALFGSVVSAALHHVDCPVVVVPQTYDAAAAADHPAGRVVVGVAAGEASDGALRWAARTAALHHRTLVPVLVRPPAEGGPSSPDASSLDASAMADLTQHARQIAPELSGALEPEVLVGQPGEELCRFVAPGDMLVVGSRGRGHLAGWFLGSSSSYVAQHAPCPVVVVRDSQ